MIRIGNKTVKTVPHFWDGIVFHPTDAIEDDWGQELLRRMAKDGAIRVVRMYTMFEDMVTLNDKGEMQFDYALNDERIDFLLSLGFTPMITYAFLPPWLCVHTEFTASIAKNKLRYKGKVVTNSYAKDPALWGEICRIYTEHLTERYGVEQVRGWYLQCYNEPDLKPFFMAEAGESKDPDAISARAREYLKLYKAFAAAVKSVDSRLQIGNSLASKAPFLDALLKELRETDTPIDFVGIHTYGTSTKFLNSGERPFDAMACVEKQRALRAIVETYYGSDMPIVNDEWGASSQGFFNIEECPQLILREKSAFAAYFGKLITYYADEKARPEKVMICLSGQHEMTVDFSGFRNFFTLHGFKKPIYNAHILASKLGEAVLAHGAAPENVTVYPTQREDGSLALLLAYAAPHFDKTLPDVTVELDLSEFGNAFSGAVWRIDETHTDPYALFLREHMSDPLNEEQIRKLTEAGELKSEALSLSNEKPLTLTLPCDSLTLIELKAK